MQLLDVIVNEKMVMVMSIFKKYSRQWGKNYNTCSMRGRSERRENKK
jgi:hypothetical protein